MKTKLGEKVIYQIYAQLDQITTAARRSRAGHSLPPRRPAVRVPCRLPSRKQKSEPMKKLLVFVCAALAAACGPRPAEQTLLRPSEYVSTLVGTQSDYALSTGTRAPYTAHQLRSMHTPETPCALLSHAINIPILNN